MEGGDSQIITAQPQEFTGGVWTTTRTLTGVRAGGFSINAVIDQATLSANNAGLKACAGAPGPENTSKAPGPENLTPGPENARATPRSGILNEKPAVERIVLPEKSLLSNLGLDEPATVTSGILPDLTIKDMCLDVSSIFPGEGLTVLNVLIANIGTGDSDHFELGLSFDSDLWIDKELPLFKAGDQMWVSYSPMCCGWVPTTWVVKSTAVFTVIADPSYYSHYSTYDPRTYKVASKITEANKKNNTLTIDRTAMRRCDAKTIKKELPPIPVKPTVRP